MSNRRKIKYGKPVSSHDKPITGAKLIEAHGPRANLVVLDPVDPDVEPPYCTHGKTTCVKCGDWCWLGCETYKEVDEGRAYGVCLPCANKHLTGLKPVGHLKDVLH